MKKIARLGMAVAVLAMTFGGVLGCSNNADTTFWYEENGLENLKAVALEGANYLTWDYDGDNAYGYMIERTSSEGTEKKSWTLGKGTVSYLDVVSGGNQLVNGVEYTYKVTPKGNYDNASARNLIAANKPTSSLAGKSASVKVKANIPLAGSKLSAYKQAKEAVLNEKGKEVEPAQASEIQTYLDNSGNGTMLYVYAPASLLYKTVVKVSTLNEAYEEDEVASVNNVDSSDKTQTVSAFPYYGAEYTVKVIKQWKAAGKYYQDSEAWETTVKEEGLNNNWSAETLNKDETASGYPKLYWNADVVNKATYTLYKAKKSGVYLDGGYTVVDSAKFSLVDKVDASGKVTGKEYNFIDKDVEDGVSYKYLLTKTINEVTGKTPAKTTVTVSLKSALTNVAAVTVTQKAYNEACLLIKWETPQTEGYTYNLYRKAYKTDSELEPAEWTPVKETPVTFVDNDATGTYKTIYSVVEDKDVKHGYTYVYKLETVVEDKVIGSKVSSKTDVTISTVKAATYFGADLLQYAADKHYEVLLQWYYDAKTDKGAKYEIYKRTWKSSADVNNDAQAWTLLDLKQNDSEVYKVIYATDTDVKSDDGYYYEYQLVTYDEYGKVIDSDYENVTTTPIGNSPSMSIMNAADVTANSIKLTFTAPDDPVLTFKSVKVYMETDLNNPEIIGTNPYDELNYKEVATFAVTDFKLEDSNKNYGEKLDSGLFNKWKTVEKTISSLTKDTSYQFFMVIEYQDGQTKTVSSFTSERTKTE